MDKLTEIMAHKRHEIAPLLRPVFADELQALNRTLPRPPSFLAALRRPDGKLAVISEIKRRSPSAGAIKEGASALAQAHRYRAAGASALSILTDTKFFVNTEGCGYPPKVNCTEFARKYRDLGENPFPCYFSKTYPELVVAEYSWDKTVRNLIIALVAPPVIFGITVGTLIFWYCPGCNKEKAE